MKKTFYSLKKYKKQMILGPIFKMLEVVFELLTPFLMKEMIDNGIPYAQMSGDYSKIWINGLMILGFCILGFCSTLVCQYFASIASQGFGTDLRNRLFKKIDELSLAEIENFGQGNLINLINNDVNRLQVSVAMMVRLVIRAPAIVIGSLICSFFIDWKIGLIFAGVIILISIFLYVILMVTSHKFVFLQKKNDQIAQTIDDGLNGSRVIRSFNAENDEVNKLKKETADYYKDSKKVMYLNASINPFTFLIINAAIVLTVFFGSNEMNISNGAFTSGSIIALISYLNQIFVALIVVSNLVVIFNKAFASKRRVDKLLLTESSIKNEPKFASFEIKKGDNLFTFKDVDFAYSKGDNLTIKNINFSIKKGENVGLIGGTGSGKSTVVKLLDRLFDTTSGDILYKGKNIKDYDLDKLHEEVSVVLQRNVLFKGTIRSNLLVGNKNATDEMLINALKEADAYDFVFDYPDNLNHEVLEGGHNFSGGQKQRLCIARALLKKSEIVVLDDSTSALDFITDRDVRKNINSIEGLTKLYVSQRATTLMNCDKIIVMDKGTIEAIGTHEELLKNSITYREIFESQVRSK
jgi:ABC-type multidrug transport system, ATPase and permease components